jgi:hypothetical protein
MVVVEREGMRGYGLGGYSLLSANVLGAVQHGWSGADVGVNCGRRGLLGARRARRARRRRGRRWRERFFFGLCNK